MDFGRSWLDFGGHLCGLDFASGGKRGISWVILDFGLVDPGLVLDGLDFVRLQREVQVGGEKSVPSAQAGRPSLELRIRPVEFPAMRDPIQP